MDELLIAVNPDAESRLPYLLRLPLAGGLVFRTSGTWPRTKALYCYPVDPDEWPDVPEIVERIPVRSCVRRGAAIDLVLDRGRENRSQIVFTTARGRQAVFWQSPRTRKQARPNVTTPTARAAGIAQLELLVDTREQYPYRFATQQVTTVRRALPCGDYATTLDERLVAAVERKSLPDLVSSLLNGTLRYALGELAAIPRAAIVVEDRYSQIYKLTWARPALVADGLAELHVRWPEVPIVFCETRQLAEEWTYRYLAADHGPDRTRGHTDGQPAREPPGRTQIRHPDRPQQRHPDRRHRLGTGWPGRLVHQPRRWQPRLAGPHHRQPIRRVLRNLHPRRLPSAVRPGGHRLRLPVPRRDVRRTHRASPARPTPGPAPGRPHPGTARRGLHPLTRADQGSPLRPATPPTRTPGCLTAPSALGSNRSTRQSRPSGPTPELVHAIPPWFDKSVRGSVRPSLRDRRSPIARWSGVADRVPSSSSGTVDRTSASVRSLRPRKGRLRVSQSEDHS